MNVIYVVKLNHKNFKMDYILPNIAKIKRIMKIAISPFGQTIVPSIIIILTNWKCIEYHKNFKMDYILPNIAKIKRIMKIAISPFGQTIVPSIIIILTNWKCIEYGGDGAVAIYSVISYVLACAQLLIQGIGDGVQPLFSYYFGANKERELHYVYNKAFFLCSIFSTLCVQ